MQKALSDMVGACRGRMEEGCDQTKKEASDAIRRFLILALDNLNQEGFGKAAALAFHAAEFLDSLGDWVSDRSARD